MSERARIVHFTDGLWRSSYMSLSYCFSSFREPIFIIGFLDKSSVLEFSKPTSYPEQRLTSFAGNVFRRQRSVL